MTYKQMSDALMTALGLSESPVAIYYADTKPEAALEWQGGSGHFCCIGRLAGVRRGFPFAVDREKPGCSGAAYFLGWDERTRPGFERFLSRDSEGKGERFKKTPELARTYLQTRKFVSANGRYCVFQRLEDVPTDVTPEVISVFADADGISGLVTLANYGRPGQHAVIAPFSSGCGTLVNEARVQALEPEPKAVIGMFDPAARPTVEKHYLSFSMPYVMFVEMVENIPGSFLEIEPWLKIKNR